MRFYDSLTVMRTLYLFCGLLVLWLACIDPSFPAKGRLVPPPSSDVIWQKFDEYRNIPFVKEKQRLTDFVTQLRADRNATAYIVSHAGRHSCKGEAQKRAERVRRYLIHSGRIQAGRIRIIDGGYQEQWMIELYIGPLGAPILTPDIIKESRSQLPREQVRIFGNCDSKFSAAKVMRRRA